jgi:ketosteroid isomerase-like protein
MEDRMETNKTTGALEGFRSYTQAFQALDARAVARHYHEPAFTVTPNGVFPLPTAAAVEKLYSRLMADLPAMGYARTDFSGLAERSIGADLAVVSGAGAWKKASGEELRRFGMTFTMLKTGETWRVVVAVIHDPPPDDR